MFVAKVGAKLVYAVDSCTRICDLAAELIKCNHLQHKIQIINKRIEEIDKFDENIDIIISQWMGMTIFRKAESICLVSSRFLSVP